MSTLMALLLTVGSWNTALVGTGVASQEGPAAPTAGTERVVIHKVGGPGHGPDQPYSVREQGAADLEGFVGGKQVVFIAPWDVLLLALLIVLVVVLIIAL